MDEKNDSIEQKANRHGVLIAMLLGAFSVILNNSILNVSIPSFMQMFDINAIQAQNVVVGFMIPMMITMSLSGYLADVLTRKFVYILGMVLFLAGSLLGMAAWDFQSLIFFRIVQGIGGGFVMPLSISILFSYYSEKERGFATGIWGVAAMVAPAIGPTIGGLILEYSSWKMLFAMNIPTSIICMIATAYFLKEKRQSKKIKFDFIGFICITIGIVCLTLGVNRIPYGFSDHGWLTICLLLIGFTGFLFFIYTELHINNPLIDIRIFQNPIFTNSTIIVAVCTASLFSGMLLLPLLLQEVLQLSALTTGLILLPQGMMMGIAMTIGGKILDRSGVRIILPAGIIILSIVTLVLGWLVGQSSQWLLIFLLIIRGIGIGFINTPATTAGLNALPSFQVSRAMSINNVIRQLTGTITVVLFSMFFESRRIIYMERMSKEAAGILSVQHSFLIMGIIVILMLPITFKMNYKKMEKKKRLARKFG
ncbi:DHA2 family efflux MFS transporter permease subunit [Niallia nealsonii]|uniref:DHA2 family efflux MFS transporter permease subunit n=1 Tax=Niallia nealsonii TaxID=115979 RepID=UPI0012FEE07B|nr:DHA2 family efflux MFS transporter permease subunit [Niallia nealsonii]